MTHVDVQIVDCIDILIWIYYLYRDGYPTCYVPTNSLKLHYDFKQIVGTPAAILLTENDEFQSLWLSLQEITKQIFKLNCKADMVYEIKVDDVRFKSVNIEHIV